MNCMNEQSISLKWVKANYAFKPTAEQARRTTRRYAPRRLNAALNVRFPKPDRLQRVEAV
jgi:hypothetical protein